MNASDALPVRWPERAAILLVVVPVALFLAAWFHPAIGIPAAAIVSWIAWRLMGSLSSSPLPSRRAILSLAILSLAWTWIAGYGGQYDQTWDHNFRNALLHDLIDHRWPVSWDTPTGTIALDYYLAWSMVPAMIGKLLGWRAASLAMALVCAIGVFLVLLVFVRVLGVWRW
mgnify:CR=1 FL=1